MPGEGVEERLKQVEDALQDHARLLRGDVRYSDPGMQARLESAETALEAIKVEAKEDAEELREFRAYVSLDDVKKNTLMRERIEFFGGVAKWIGPVMMGAGVMQVVRWLASS